MDKTTYKKIFRKSEKIFLERKKKYGDSMKEIDLHTTIGLIKMKADRSYNGGLGSKLEDELLDIINYCAFALNKYYEQLEGGEKDEYEDCYVVGCDCDGCNAYRLRHKQTTRR
jgi:hypothetical protein